MTVTTIHPLALVEPGAQLGTGVSVGPFCTVAATAEIGDNVDLVSHVAIMEGTRIGAGCKIYPQAVLGAPPQNRAHKGGPTTLSIGRDCIVREGVTMHRGSDSSRGETRVGDNGFFLAYSHVAHDCIVGNNVTMANVATLGGHVEVGDFASFGGLSAVHQFVRVGHHAFLGGASPLYGDLIPYGIASGSGGKLRGLNIIGMKRSGLPRAEIHAIRQAYRMLFDPSQPLAQNMIAVRAAFAGQPKVIDLLDFMAGAGKRQLAVPALRSTDGDDGDGDD